MTQKVIRADPRRPGNRGAGPQGNRQLSAAGVEAVTDKRRAIPVSRESRSALPFCICSPFLKINQVAK